MKHKIAMCTNSSSGNPNLGAKLRGASKRVILQLHIKNAPFETSMAKSPGY